MSDSARPRRRYDGAKRQTHAVETRRRVVTAAAAVFVERGWVAATIPRIAAAAGVAVETVYRAAPGKAGLLAEAVQAALAGGAERAEVEVEARPGIARVIAEPDPARALQAYAATQPGVWSRVGPLLRVLDSAAAGEPALAELKRRHTEQRLTGLRRFADLLDERGALRPDLTAERAAHLIVTICAQANYDSLVTALGWTHDEYRDWLGRALVASLLG